MVELTRRFFLGGAIALVAAKTFVPSVNAMKNMPTIYGNGRDDDSYGFRALFANDPVTFNKEQIGVESHEGIIFHHGYFKINNTVQIPAKTKITMQRAHFSGLKLDENSPFFLCEDYSGHQIVGNGVIFELKEGANNRLIEYAPIIKERKNDPESTLYTVDNLAKFI